MILYSVSHWAADGTRNSEFTNKLERKTHGTELRFRRVSPCFVGAASAKADLFSQLDNENRPIKTKPKRLFFATDNNICCIDATRVNLQAPQTYTSSPIEAANILITSN